MDMSNYLYHDGEQELHGFLAYDEKITEPRPAILIAHDWTGRNEFACRQAEKMAELGYVGFAIDMYGNGRLGESRDEKMALMQPLAADRALLRQRIQAALDALITMEEVDNSRVGAMGFCFGGLCVLDLARTGADLRGVVSFHGLLNKPDDLPNEIIKSKILALHGYDDPLVPAEEVQAFCQEMEAAGVDWQLHVYGQTMHAFTNPEADDAYFGTVYNACTANRAMQSMRAFFLEVLK